MEETILYTYRYTWKTSEGKCGFKVITETKEGHNEFVLSLKDYLNHANLKTAVYREYLGEFDYSRLLELPEIVIAEENICLEVKDNEEV
ncbi:hypothetical protein [Dipodfec virus UOA04_Rod_751]|nr:hypothetical protein [Dipodfec virus UOA04_Rod_751]